MTKGTFFLLFSAISISSVILFDEVTNDNLSNIFRLTIILYFILIAFWVVGTFITIIYLPALWSLFIFYSGIVLWRIINIAIYGIPRSTIIIYLILEILGSMISFWLINIDNNKNRAP